MASLKTSDLVLVWLMADLCGQMEIHLRPWLLHCDRRCALNNVLYTLQQLEIHTNRISPGNFLNPGMCSAPCSKTLADVECLANVEDVIVALGSGLPLCNKHVKSSTLPMPLMCGLGSLSLISQKAVFFCRA